MRLYVPATVSTLRSLAAAGSLAAPVSAFAVTAALTSWVSADEPVEETEELEFAALTEAARGSLRLLAGTPDETARRVVLAIEVSSTDVTVVDAAPDAWPGAVLVPADVPLSALVSVHLDDQSAASVVRAAAEAVGRADGDDTDAEQVVERCADLALLWYTPAELPALILR